jgi:hypothetical protein
MITDRPQENYLQLSLTGWKKRKRLDVWWKEQEAITWKIVQWRDTGLDRGRDSTHFPLES